MDGQHFFQEPIVDPFPTPRSSFRVKSRPIKLPCLSKNDEDFEASVKGGVARPLCYARALNIKED